MNAPHTTRDGDGGAGLDAFMHRLATDRNLRVRLRYAELMQDGQRDHDAALCQVVDEEVAAAPAVGGMARGDGQGAPEPFPDGFEGRIVSVEHPLIPSMTVVGWVFVDRDVGLAEVHRIAVAAASPPQGSETRAGGETDEAVKPCHWGGGNDVIWCATCGAEYAYAKGEKQPPCPRAAPVDEHPQGEEPWWQVLGIAETANREAIEAAYRALARDRHPDRPGGSHDLMSDLNRARDAGLKARGAPHA